MSMSGEMTPSFVRKRLKRGLIAVGALIVLVMGAVGYHIVTSHAAPQTSVTLGPDAVPSQILGARLLGPHATSDALTIEFAMTPNHVDTLNALLAQLYDKTSPQYQQWLPTGAFEARFGPTSAQIARLNSFMASAGAQPAPDAPSAFLVRYRGTTATMERAFHVQINDYLLADGTRAFANATPPTLPADIAGMVQGVLGLSNTTRLHSNIETPRKVNGVVPSYGASPGGTGLSPFQVRSIYDANPMYHYTNGKGYTLGLYELSNWRLSDVQKFETTFHLPNVPIDSLYVDGGPGNDHSGASEVVLDVDMQIALAPGIGKLYVYNAANGTNGVIDEYSVMAHQNLASVISSSWGICEPATIAVQRSAEETALMQMAAQGQSFFSAAGDTGAYDCEQNFTTSYKYFGYLEVGDPASDPYATGVGGSSFFQTFDPGGAGSPSYPGNTKEYVWNPFDFCHNYPININGHDYYCPYGAGGGGFSHVWARPSYQNGPGVDTKVNARQVPDVTINDDPNSGYGIYCTDPGDTYCKDNPGWIQFGGTSAGAPLWAGIAVLADGYHHRRLGLFNQQLYNILRLSNAYTKYFHDIEYPVVTLGRSGTISRNEEYPCLLNTRCHRVRIPTAPSRMAFAMAARMDANGFTAAAVAASGGKPKGHRCTG
jgi:subtilase family serine protease